MRYCYWKVLQLREIAFWVLSHPSQAPALFSTVYSGHAWACSKSTTSCCVESSYLCWLRFDELPQDCFVVSCLFVRIRASLLAIASSEASRCPMSGWVCQPKPFWIPVGDSFKKAKDQAPQIRVKSSPRLQKCRSIPLRYLGSLRSPMIKHVFGNELRHHCFRCGNDQNATSFIHVSLDPFLSVWYYRFPMRLSCLVANNSTPQEMIFLLHGPN